MMRRTFIVSALIVILSLSFLSLATSDFEISDEYSVSDPYIPVFRNDKQYASVISWDDYPVSDRNVSYMEDSLGMKHTSFIVTQRIDDEHEACCLDMMFRGHDIQSHGWKHIALGETDNLTLVREVLERSYGEIQDKFGFEPILFAYPFGSADENSTSIAMEYYDLGRGIQYEGKERIGEWPITHKEYAGHSLVNPNGICDDSVHKIYGQFEKMITEQKPAPFNPEQDNMIKNVNSSRVFKLYGHTTDSFINESSMEELENQLTRLSNRNDTWFTSWGEAIAYEKARSLTNLSELTVADNLSLNMVVEDEIERYPVEITVKAEVPSLWKNPVVQIGNKYVSNANTIEKNQSKWIMFNVVPHNCSIRIADGVSPDESKPSVNNPTLEYLSGNTVIRFDVNDDHGFISDVNATLSNGTYTEHFSIVENPLFWNNETYGLVADSYIGGNLSLTVHALDTNGNYVLHRFNVSQL
ncbi:MAG: polysaccharide deacetylase family protein [Candidatus Lokiarchaeota archaeon]|nr:polysaccharide deacetylase family protein [Candidatus Lokiarchaeota archaeon]